MILCGIASIQKNKVLKVRRERGERRKKKKKVRAREKARDSQKDGMHGKENNARVDIAATHWRGTKVYCSVKESETKIVVK